MSTPAVTYLEVKMIVDGEPRRFVWVEPERIEALFKQDARLSTYLGYWRDVPPPPNYGARDGHWHPGSDLPDPPPPDGAGGRSG